MANLNKTSVRNEVDQVKADFEQLCAKDSVSPEMKILFNSLFTGQTGLNHTIVNPTVSTFSI